MSDTYTGWDGESYPWPPPDGWYEASDGQWWAPGTGPNPPPAAAPSAFPPPTPEPDPASYPPPTAAAPQHGVDVDSGRTAQIPSYDDGQLQRTQQLPPGLGAQDANRTIPAHGQQTNAAPPTAFAGGPPDASGSPSWDQAAGSSAPGASADSGDGGRGGSALLGLVGVVLALVLAGGAFLLLRDNSANDETAATEASAGTDSTTGESAEGNDEAGSQDTTPTSALDSSTITDPEPTDSSGTTDSSGATDSTGSTGSTENSSTTALTGTEVETFRSILADNGLTSVALTDEELSSFGTTFCLFAVSSQNETDYVEFRERAIAETESDLTEDELTLVIDAAVVVFCPDEADRLGISV